MNSLVTITEKSTELANISYSLATISGNPIHCFYKEDGTVITAGQPIFDKDAIYRRDDISWEIGEIITDSNILTVIDGYSTKVIVSVLNNFFSTDGIDIYQIFTTKDYAKDKLLKLKAELNRRSRDNGRKFRFVIFYCVTELISALYENVESRSFSEGTSSIQEDAFKKEIYEILQQHDTSDIHFECSNVVGRSRIRYRKHDDLIIYKDYKYEEIKKLIEIAYSVIASKEETGSTMAGVTLDFKVPQDAKICFTYQGINFELRAGTLPRTTEAGIDLTLRVLKCGRTQKFRLLEEYGYETFQLVQYKSAARKNAGIILICGVTGSGKNESMMSAIHYMNEHYNGLKKFISAEVPVERDIENVTQVNIDSADDTEEGRAAVSEKLNRVLDSILRNDPDVLMTNEIRNAMTAKYAINASRTGHPFLTTLHCSEANAAPARLEDLDVSRASIAAADVISLIVSQDLVKRVCPYCSQSLDQIDASKPIVAKVIDWCEKLDLVDYVEQIRFAKPGGCTHCHNDENGTIGRTPVAEFLTPNPLIKKCWGAGNDDEAKREWLSSEDGVTKLEHAIIKMCRGEITPDTIEKYGDPLISISERKALGVAPFNIHRFL